MIGTTSSRAFFSENLAGLGLAVRRRARHDELAVHEYVSARGRGVRTGFFLGVLLRLDGIMALRIGRLLGGRDADAQPDEERRGGERQMDEAHGRNS